MVVKLKGVDANHSISFIKDTEKGWFHKYVKVVRPILLKSAAFQDNQRARKIFEEFEVIVDSP